MGIYDRDYYRNEGPSIFDSFLPTGYICRWLIGINVAVFFLQLLTRQAMGPTFDDLGHQVRNGGFGPFTDFLILDPAEVLHHGQVWRLLTYAFLHDPDSLMHIFFNMLFLWWFGSDVEQLYGRKEFLAFYLTAAFLGGVVYAATAAQAPCLGASGAVTALLVLCAMHFPHRLIYIFLFLPVPIWLFAIFNVARDAYALMSHTERGVAVSVHLAGAGFAFVYYKLQFRIVQPFRALMWWKNLRSRPRLKIFDPIPEDEEPVAVSAGVTPNTMDEHLEAKLDALLEKIARNGKESLTDQERKILAQAADMYKRKRI